MTFLRKTTQTVTLLLVFFVGTMGAIPPGVDLELCIGKDGHVDFSLNKCHDGAAPVRPSKDPSHFYASAHCDDCQHVVVGCNTMREVVRTDEKSGIHKTTPEKDPSGTLFSPSECLAAAAGALPGSDVYPVSPKDVSSSHLVFLRTVVLLI